MIFSNPRKTLGPNTQKWLGVRYAALLLFALNSCGEQETKESLMIIKPSSPQVEDFTLPSARFTSPHSITVTVETRKTYQWYCAQCHGVEGKGNGINSKHVTVPPRNHTKPDYLETRSDQELFDAIRLGGLQVGRAPCMPAWGRTLDEEMMWSLVHYIRELCNCEAV